ncbi:MAG: DUF2203 domain-containing protein [Gemmatimonadota bacterium]|nr:DUF2203 domain-containing protein [Gemmatimonadota bacterium]
MDPKYFTRDEANRTLPLVRRIVQDIVDDYGRWKECLAKYELAAANQRPEDGESEAAVELRERVDAVAQHINGYIAELEQIGCVLKGFDDGLVDFRGQLEGRDVWLCWRLGEPDVGHWHEIDEGYRNRRPFEREPAGGPLDR